MPYVQLVLSIPSSFAPNRMSTAMCQSPTAGQALWKAGDWIPMLAAKNLSSWRRLVWRFPNKGCQDRKCSGYGCI